MLGYKLKILCFIGLFCLINETKSQGFSEIKQVNRTFPVDNTTRLKVINKYGIVHLVPWEKDSIKFEISISVTSDNNSKVGDLLDDIWINFKSDKYYVTATTEIGKRRRNIFADFKKIAESLLASESQIKINYLIYMPVYSDVELNNKYGDVYLEILKSDLKLSMSNGDLKAGTIEGDCEIDFSFGTASINSVSNVSLKLLDAEMDINLANQVIVTDSKMSELTVEKAGLIRINSRRDKFHFYNIGSIYGITDFTDVEIVNVIEEIDLNMKYGSLNLEISDPDFSLININSQNTDIFINTKEEVKYYTEIRHYKVSLKVPSIITDSEEKSLGNGETLTVFSNSGDDELAFIKIKARECIVNYIIK